MQTLIIIIIFLLGSFYADTEGRREAFYYDMFPHKHPDIHWMFYIQRFSLMLISAIATWNWIYGIILSAVMVLNFSFWHNGSYYRTRNDLNPKVYPKRFKDSSVTSTAVMEFSYNARLILAIISWLGLAALLYLTTI